eukprot:2251955-Pleurochrysis_carterae.AAC.2
MRENRSEHGAAGEISCSRYPSHVERLEEQVCRSCSLGSTLASLLTFVGDGCRAALRPESTAATPTASANARPSTTAERP